MHSPEPWRLVEKETEVEVLDAKGNLVYFAGNGVLPGSQSQIDTNRRIVACVNACKDINPEAVPETLDACRLMLVEQERMSHAMRLGITPGMRAARAAIAKATPPVTS